MNNNERMVMVYGSDTPLGRILVSRLEADDGVIPLARHEDYFTEKVAWNIHRDIRSTKPDVIINCMITPDAGRYPHAAMSRFIAPSHAILQQARSTGCRYILCSSAIVYGQQESPVDRNGYSEYDPWLSISEDPWRAICQSVEASLFQQLCPFNFQAKAETHRRFEYYCLRLGHLLFEKPRHETPFDAYTLGRAVHAAVDGKVNFVCSNTLNKISPISCETVVDVLRELITTRPRPVSGTYHIGSRDSATLDQFFSFLSMKTRTAVCLGSTCGGGTTPIEIYGVDSDQSLDTWFWSSRGKTKLQTWQEELSRSLEGSKISKS